MIWKVRFTNKTLKTITFQLPCLDYDVPKYLTWFKAPFLITGFIMRIDPNDFNSNSLMTQTLWKYLSCQNDGYNFQQSTYFKVKTSHKITMKIWIQHRYLVASYIFFVNCLYFRPSAFRNNYSNTCWLIQTTISGSVKSMKEVLIFCHKERSKSRAHVRWRHRSRQTGFAPIRSCRRKSGWVARNFYFFILHFSLPKAFNIHR